MVGMLSIAWVVDSTRLVPTSGSWWRSQKGRQDPEEKLPKLCWESSAWKQTCRYCQETRDMCRAWEGCSEVLKWTWKNKVLWNVQSMAIKQDEFHPRQLNSCFHKARYWKVWGFCGKKICGKGNLKWFYDFIWKKPTYSNVFTAIWLFYDQKYVLLSSKAEESPAQNKQLAKIIKFGFLTVACKIHVSTARYVSHPHSSQKRPTPTNSAVWRTLLTQGSHTHMAKVSITTEDGLAHGSDGDLHFVDLYSRASWILFFCTGHTRHNILPVYTRSYLLSRRVHDASWDMQSEEEPQW